ncbi:MAG: CocE/NonD family hydrolase [Steroidobacteraceae bacterium]
MISGKHLEGRMLTVFVRTRDGEQLATDVYLPQEPGPHPVLLERTPYDRRGTNHADYTRRSVKPISKPEVAQFFVKAGYVYVLQDCRGRFDSSGVFEKYVNEADDGIDTLEWILSQPWCDGRIGTVGFSYGAHVQTAVAARGPQALRVMFIDSGGFSSAYDSGIRQGGAYELKQLTWAFKHAKIAAKEKLSNVEQQALEDTDIGPWMSRIWTPGHSPISAVPEYESYVIQQWRHDLFDEFWQRPEFYAKGYYHQFPDVPMVFVSSWFDPYALTASENYVGLAAIKNGPIRLLLGPWIHGRRSDSYAGDVDFGEDSVVDGTIAPDYLELKRGWFDQHLAQKRITHYLDAPVTVFVMGGGSGDLDEHGRLRHGGRWLRTTAWPPPDSERTAFYVTGAGQLERHAATETSHVEWVFDPDHPVPTVGGAITSGAPVMFGGAFDQRETSQFFASRANDAPLADRSDVVIFETQPFEDAVEIVGPMTAVLWVSTSAYDTDFTVKVIDVYPPSRALPNGYAMNLTDGILRLRFRNSFEAAQLATPHQMYCIKVLLPPTANRFARGHRLRIDIASSNFPKFDVNPNTGAPAGTPSEPIVAHNRLHFGPDLQSRLEVYVLNIEPHETRP